jgi:UDP:flavonoid glycosyltransferase YjiC (YdhE family)
MVFFETGSQGHFQRMRPLISAVAKRGIDVYVFTSDHFARAVSDAGGQFVDLYAGRPLDEADRISRPFPCRSVSFAGHFGEAVAKEVAALAPSHIVADTFAVVGRVAATELDLPYVNVCNGHNSNPAVVVPRLRVDPRVDIAPSCWRAVETLRDRFGMDNASPFVYADGLSSLLNIYCEPPQYLTDEERRAFEPVAFFGSLASLNELEANGRARGIAWPGDGNADVRLYSALGTGAWRYYRAEILAAFVAISDAVARRPSWTAQLSMGGGDFSADEVATLQRPNVKASSFVDQWAVLRQADVFVTHHGLNSTHEAVFNEVPMLSYPIFGDQPGMAARCAELGLAIPLVTTPRHPIDADHVEAAIDSLVADDDKIHSSLARARTWELDVIASRDEVVDRLLAVG